MAELYKMPRIICHSCHREFVLIDLAMSAEWTHDEVGFQQARSDFCPFCGDLQPQPPGDDELWVNIHHPCYEIDVRDRSEWGEHDPRRQGYVPLEELRRMVRLIWPDREVPGE